MRTVQAVDVVRRKRRALLGLDDRQIISLYSLKPSASAGGKIWPRQATRSAERTRQ